MPSSLGLAVEESSWAGLWLDCWAYSCDGPQRARGPGSVTVLSQCSTKNEKLKRNQRKTRSSSPEGVKRCFISVLYGSSEFYWGVLESSPLTYHSGKNSVIFGELCCDLDGVCCWPDGSWVKGLWRGQLGEACLGLDQLQLDLDSPENDWTFKRSGYRAKLLKTQTEGPTGGCYEEEGSTILHPDTRWCQPVSHFFAREVHSEAGPSITMTELYMQLHRD